MTTTKNKNAALQISFDQYGNPFNEDYDDHFYSVSDGRDECRHVFINGNELSSRLTRSDSFTIAELGFGTGLNFLETWNFWRNIRSPNQHLSFVSFELHPLPAETISRAISSWPELEEIARQMLAFWANRCDRPGPWRIDQQTKLEVIIGDAEQKVGRWNSKADAWYLDGFSPQNNPAMWSESLMQKVCEHTNSGGTFASYTSAGWVRNNLLKAGFKVERVAGHGRKRHMSIGYKPS